MKYFGLYFGLISFGIGCIFLMFSFLIEKEKCSHTYKNDNIVCDSTSNKNQTTSCVIPGQMWKSKTKNPFIKYVIYYKVLDVNGEYVQYRYCVNDIKNIDNPDSSSMGSDRLYFFTYNVKISDPVTTK